ncbi:MAG: diguanylate cyclase [Bacillota bacterium]
MIRNIFNEEDQLITYRVLLLVMIFLYLGFGIIYKSATSAVDPFPLKQRILISALALIILIASFFSKLIKDNLYKIIYAIIYIANLQLVYFASINKYSVTYAISILAVIIITNFLLRTIQELKFYNAIMTGLLIVSVSFTPNTLVNKELYICFVILISSISYLVHKSKIEFINEFKASKQEYAKLYEEQNILLSNMDIQVWCLTAIDQYGTVNQAHADFLGIKKERFNNKHIQELLTKQKFKKYAALNRLAFQKKEKIDFEYWTENYQGDRRLLLVSITPKLTKNNQVEYLIYTAKDITEKRLNQQEIKHLNLNDSLTGLLNRRGFEQKLKQFDTEKQLPLSIIVGDINGLKLVNDAFGHQSGDKLLKETAKILKSSCRGKDVVARWGGDEFVMLLPQTDKEDVAKVQARIKEKTKKRKIKLLEISISLGNATKIKNSENINTIWKKADERMYNKKLKESKRFHDEVIESLEQHLKEKTNENSKHINHMKQLAFKIAQNLDLPDSKLEDLELLAELHDLGKVAVERQILYKRGPLTEQEWAEIKKHPEVGCQIAESSPELSGIASGILSHHEWWDGSGYPQGLQGTEIPLIARIISIADAYDVMTNYRIYKKTRSKEQALEELKDKAGSQFDPNLVDIFIEEMKN